MEQSGHNCSYLAIFFSLMFFSSNITGFYQKKSNFPSGRRIDKVQVMRKIPTPRIFGKIEDLGEMFEGGFAYVCFEYFCSGLQGYKTPSQSSAHAWSRDPHQLKEKGFTFIVWPPLTWAKLENFPSLVLAHDIYFQINWQFPGCRLNKPQSSTFTSQSIHSPNNFVSARIKKVRIHLLLVLIKYWLWSNLLFQQNLWDMYLKSSKLYLIILIYSS